MEQTQERPQRTVTATVKSKAQEQGGWKIELDIPSFESQYPTIVTRVSDFIAFKLQPGASYPLILEQQNLKKGKDGSRPYNFYYGLVGIDDQYERRPVPGPGNTEIIDKAPASFPLPDDTAAARERATNRRTALMQAVEFAGQKQHGSEYDIIDLITIAEEFYRFLSNPPVEATDPVLQDDLEMPF